MKTAAETRTTELPAKGKGSEHLRDFAETVTRGDNLGFLHPLNETILTAGNNGYP